MLLIKPSAFALACLAIAAPQSSAPEKKQSKGFDEGPFLDVSALRGSRVLGVEYYEQSQMYSLWLRPKEQSIDALVKELMKDLPKFKSHRLGTGNHYAVTGSQGGMSVEYAVALADPANLNSPQDLQFTTTKNGVVVVRLMLSGKLP